MHAPAPSSSTLVGRDRALALLRERLAAALAGNGGLVLISGEAGIGKTALAEVVCRDAEARGATVLVGRCFDLTGTPPYGPWVDLFSRYQLMTDLMPPDTFRPGDAPGSVTSQTDLFNQARDFLTALAASHPALLLLEDLHIPA